MRIGDYTTADIRYTRSRNRRKILATTPVTGAKIL